jgi:hypothetical protein
MPDLVCLMQYPNAARRLSGTPLEALTINCCMWGEVDPKSAVESRAMCAAVLPSIFWCADSHRRSRLIGFHNGFVFQTYWNDHAVLRRVSDDLRCSVLTAIETAQRRICSQQMMK